MSEHDAPTSAHAGSTTEGAAAGGSAHREQAALHGVRVVDFSHFIAGPYASMILADHGAQVIKIEAPGRGDDYRHSRMAGRDEWGAPFLSVNRNKRSVAVDLSTEEGREIVRALIDTADIVLENFTTGVMARHGLDYETLAATNPRLIYCSVSAAGRTGPLAARAGFDPIAQAESGYMHLTALRDATTVVAGPPIIDMTTAMMAANAMLAALAARGRTGRGQYIETSLLDQSISLLGYHAITYLLTGLDTRDPGLTPRKIPAVGTYQTADRPIALCCINDRTFEHLVVDVLDRPDLFAPPYDTQSGRARNSIVLNEALDAVLLTRSRSEWLAAMQSAGVPAAAQATLPEALASAEVRSREMVGTIPHTAHGQVPNVSLAPRLHGTPTVDPVGAPILGEHTFEVLADVLGFDSERLAALASRRVIADAGIG